MSSDGSITLVWADGDHRFRLAIGHLRELQEKCDSGPAEIMRRLRDGTWRVDDVRETIRLGLIGGGMKPAPDALVLVTRYVDNRPLMESVLPALYVLTAALVGVPDDQPRVGGSGKDDTEGVGSSSPSSTEQEPHLDGMPVQSIN